jgi:hypothetical protein
MSNTSKQDFIKDALQKVHFYIESQFWSKLGNDKLNNWLQNFKSLDEKYCAAKLLDRFVFYSEKDTIRLLEFGLNEIIFKRYVLKEEITHNFLLKNSEILKMKEDFFSKCFFLPLITMSNVSESSFAIARYLTNDLGIDEKKILDPNNLKSSVLKECKNIIIFDDFIGSGRQILDYWNYGEIILDKEPIKTRDIKSLFNEIEIEYFCLVCTEDGYFNFIEENDGIGLKLTFCEKLTSKYKVFGSNSIYFDNDEVEACKEILTNLCSKNNIELLGYKGYDYAIAFHHSIPDTCLPLFFRQEKNWNPLFKNKKTSINVNI